MPKLQTCRNPIDKTMSILYHDSHIKQVHAVNEKETDGMLQRAGGHRYRTMPSEYNAGWYREFAPVP